jgi:hypothetical protein
VGNKREETRFELHSLADDIKEEKNLAKTWYSIRKEAQWRS